MDAQPEDQLGQRSPAALKTALAVLLLLVLFLSLIPPLLAGRYARASADDYSYGYHTHAAVQQGSGLFSAVWRTVSTDYKTWQGSFSAMALMTLTPCIFSEQAYWVTAVVMLGSVLLGTFLLLRTLIVKCAGGGWQDWICVCAPMLLVSLQLLPSPHNSFYWWNGAVYYTFTYGVSLIYLERFVSLLWRGRGSWQILLPGCLLGLFVGGSNYVSGLLCLMIGCVLLLFALIRRRAPLPAAVLLLSLALPFAVNMAAPGNQVRQDGLTAMGPVDAILAAVTRGLGDAIIWPNWPNLLLCLALLPLLYRLAGRVSFSFPLPAAFAVLSFLLFAAQNTPHFYAASTAGPLRLRNIIYLSYYWLLLANEWYLLGWLRRRVVPKLRPAAVQYRRARPFWYGALALLALFCLFRYGPASFTGEAIHELADGSAQRFAQACDSRLTALQDPEQGNPRFASIAAKPVLLYHSDLSADPSVWVNQAVANFYGKETVAVLQSAS